jgi:hypothetical protein
MPPTTASEMSKVVIVMSSRRIALAEVEILEADEVGLHRTEAAVFGTVEHVRLVER